MARRVRFFSAQIDRERDPVYIRPLYDSAPLIAVGPRAAQTIDDLDVTLSEHESRLLEMNEALRGAQWTSGGTHRGPPCPTRNRRFLPAGTLITSIPPLAVG
jgi:hypothetical protein